MINDTKPRIFAHRGGLGENPENTIYAFKRSVEIGVYAIELDIHRTKDNVVVVCHDSTVNRTTNGKGKIRKFLYKDLLCFDASTYFHKIAKISGKNGLEKVNSFIIPRLEDVLKAFPEVMKNIEIKDNSSKTVDLVVSLIKNYKQEKKIILCAKNKKIKDLVFKSLSKENIGASQLEAIITIISRGRITSSGYKYLEIPFRWAGIRLVSKKMSQRLKLQDIDIIVWTINSEKDYELCRSLGIYGVITDYPSKLLRKLN